MRLHYPFYIPTPLYLFVMHPLSPYVFHPCNHALTFNSREPPPPPLYHSPTFLYFPVCGSSFCVCHFQELMGLFGLA